MSVDSRKVSCTYINISRQLSRNKSCIGLVPQALYESAAKSAMCLNASLSEKETGTENELRHCNRALSLSLVLDFSLNEASVCITDNKTDR
jgi:hypothetical protein